MTLRYALLAAILAIGVPPAARADPRLDEKVYDPYVENGVAELEVRGASALGGPLGGATTTVVEGEYGLDDRLSLALVGVVERDPGASPRLSALGLEAVAYAGQIPVIGVDTGVYLEYDQGLGGALSSGEAKLLLAKTAGRFQGLLNLIAERPFGAPAGDGFADYGWAASATWRCVGAWRLGAEGIGDLGTDHAFLGRQGSYLGPQVKWRGRPAHAPFELELDAGWLAAVGPARREADSQLRLVLEMERRF